ncbi:MAG TPA: DUF4097 family beta strand repeat-containing protein [Gemmatimonadaceae bacterium]
MSLPRFVLTAASLFSLAIATPRANAQVGGSREDLEFKWSKQIRAGGTLVIRNNNGPISVQQASGDRVEVTATKRVHPRGRAADVGFDVQETGDQIEVCTIYGRQDSCRDRGNGGIDNVRVTVEFTVLVPRSARLRVATGNGKILIDRTGADVSATTGNGDISIGETAGRVDATTGNGDVQIDGANGPVNVTTGNGRIFAVTSRGGVDANTGNGDIDVRIKSGPIERDMKFTSGSGTIRVAVPAEFNGRIDASSGNGSLRTEFEISIIGRLDSHHVRGTIGSGGPLIRMLTGNGMIELRKN